MELASPENGEPPPPPGQEIKSEAAIEDKLEDRYQKLRGVALRLKKKVAEQAEEINQLEEVKARLTEKKQTALKVQQEFDLAQDEIERLKKSEANLQKDLKSALEANIKLKEVDFDKTAQIQSLTTSHKALREKVEKNETIENELTIWRNRAKELEDENKELKNADALQEKRQTAIMSLEITDYERKLQLAYQELENSKQEISSQSSTIEKLEDNIKSLEVKVESLTSNIDQLTSMKENFQTDIERKAEKIGFLQDEISKANEKFHEKKTELFQLQSEYENCKLTFASESKALVERNGMLQKTIAVLEHKIAALEENKRSRESQISNQKLEMQQLETEFRNYKIKAQAMLKSQKPTQSTINQEKDELENLQKIVQDFHSEISILRSDLQTLRLENENLIMEKSELNAKVKQIKTESLEKEVRLSSEIQKLRSDIRSKESEMKKLIEEHQANRDLMEISSKEQLATIKQNHDAKLKSLKEQLEMAKVMSNTEVYTSNEIFDKPSPSSDSDASNSKEHKSEFKSLEREAPFGGNNSRLLAQNNLDRLQQPLTIDTSSSMSYDQLRMIPRGECEGSESASTYLPRADNYNISFEQLLSSSFDSASKLSSDSDLVQRPDVTQVMKELSRCQSQVKHLTGVLRESESNCERLTQLSEALKEEIRRVERDKERKEHLQENSEYLKNVLLKFITLNGEDERLRLIPVFKTMLRLAPEEVTRLEVSVRESQSNRDGGGGKGWSSYLQKWTA